MSGYLTKMTAGALLNKDYELENWWKPKKGHDAANDERLSAFCDELTEAYSDLRAADRYLSRSANPGLRLISYRFISLYLQWGALDVLVRRADLGRSFTRGRIGNPNPFQIGLSALFAAKPDMLPASTKERIGKQQWYAYRHFIPWEELDEFLLAVHGQSIPHMIKQQYVIPELREMVIENLATRACHPLLRASYQADVLNEADQMFADRGKAIK